MYSLNNYGGSSIVPYSNNRAITVPVSAGALRAAVDYGKQAGGYIADAYTNAVRVKREAGTPFLRGETKRVKSERNYSKDNPLKTFIPKAKMVGDYGGSGFKRTFRQKRFSRRRRFRFKRRFINARRVVKYISLWRIQPNPALTPTPAAGQAYRYTYFTVNPILAIQNVLADSSTVANAVNIMPRGQLMFTSKLWAQIKIKNPFSLTIHYRIIWAKVTQDATPTDLAYIEPWTPVYTQDAWKMSHASLIKQVVGTLPPDSEHNLNFSVKPGFIRLMDPSEAPFLYTAYIWTWSELQIQSGATFSDTVTLGYIDVATVIISRVGSNIVCDQGLNVNNNAKHGYETGLTAIVTPKVRAADKMGGATF